MKTSKKLIILAAITTSLLCAQLRANAFNGDSNKIYKFNCPTGKAVLDNGLARGPDDQYIIIFDHTNYKWMPPELRLNGQLPTMISLDHLGPGKAVLFGSEVRCVYHTKAGPIALRLIEPSFYRNPVVNCDGNPRCIQIEQ